MLGMVEVQADAGVPVVARMVGRAQQQLAAHAEVAHDRPIGADRQPQELAASHGRLDRGPRQERLEVAGCRDVAGQGTRVEHVDGGDARAGDGRRQSGADDLDLGELGHVSGR